MSKKSIATAIPFSTLPKKLWLELLTQASIDSSIRWAELSKKSELRIIQILTSSSYLIEGRGPFGEEFVTAGGIDLKEVNLNLMESKLCSDLHFAGEVLNVDGLTGGFNFQHCWTSGWLAGNAIAKTT